MISSDGWQPVPLLSRWGPLGWANCIHDIAIANLPCNWLQCQENSLDSIHVEWLHGYAGTYFKRVTAGQEPEFNHGRAGEGNRTTDTKLRFDPFKYGIIKRRVTNGRDERHADFAR